MFKYLKEEGFYSDLYDLMTIKECLGIQEYWNKRIKRSREVREKLVSWGMEFQLYFVKGDRYRSKRSFIQERIEEGRKRDEKLNSTEEPEGMSCFKCRIALKVVSRDLYCDTLRVLFCFECPKCGKRKGIFEDGKEFVSKGTKLSKAELAEWDKEDAESKVKDKELLKKYRAEFCLSETEGEEYILDSNRMKEFSLFLKDMKEKKDDPDYEKAMNLKKLTIVELEKFLKGVLVNENYIKLVFDKPIIDRHVIMPLTVQDGDSTRKEYDSVHMLERVLKKSLESTNWRLMSQGVNYRLGVLSCQLKGYEQEADLIKIVKFKKSTG